MRTAAAETSVRRILRSSSILGELSESELDTLAQAVRLSRCDRGEYIWSTGHTADFFGLVGSGFVKMVRSNSSGVEVTLEIMGPGQLFGMLGTVSGEGCPLTAIGLTRTQYLKIPKTLFLELYERSPRLQKKLVQRAAVQMHSKLDFMALLSTGRVEERLAAVLFLLAESYGEKVEGAIHLSIPMTRQELGEIAGTTTETTIRVLSKWSKAGIVTTDHHFISIEQPDALTAYLRG